MNRIIRTPMIMVLVAGLSAPVITAMAQEHSRHGGHDTHTQQHGQHGQHGQHDHHDHATVVGGPGNPDRVDRTIDVVADDTMAFRHPPINIRAGETIRFRVTNTGRLVHEFSIGTVAEHRAHQVMMRENPDMSHDGSDGSVTLQPGETREMIWHFDQVPEERVEAACNLPGHYEAGMFSQIRIRQ